MLILTVVPMIALSTSLISIAYLLFAIWRVADFRALTRPSGTYQPAVTILKPVCGLDANLYDNLRSFCDQDYPLYQVVFGVSDPTDPAIETIERVIKEFPERDLALVVNGRIIGSNLKVSNLANMYELAKHDFLVIADSDMRVGRDYLSAVIVPFQDLEVGAVTCLYKGSPLGGLASILSTTFINEWFLPSVLVALVFQEIRFCFGATMAVRRDALAAIGGFEALGSFLADDYMLGKLVSDQGYKVRLAPYVVENVVLEPSLSTLFQHELRWARTVRSVRPVGFAFSFLTYAISNCLLFLLVSPSVYLSIFMISVSVALRILLHWVVRSSFKVYHPVPLWLIPIRDVLCFVVWATSFLSRNVYWRANNFSVQPNGYLAMKGPRAL